MRPRKFLWRIYLSFFASGLLAFALITWHSISALHRFQKEQVGNDLLFQARLVAGETASLPADAEPQQFDKLCKEIGRSTRTRITIVASDGQVLGDSEEDPGAMDNHKDRPEIADALTGRIGQSTRFSNTIRRTMLYLAVPARGAGRAAVVRTSLPLSVMDWAMRSVHKQLLAGVAMIAFIFALVTLFISRQMSRPIDEMRSVAEKLARGELDARVPEAGYAELGSLARALNQMASQLSERVRTITEQRNEQNAVFNSMVEGVIAVDQDERILRLNPAVAVLLQIQGVEAQGRSMQEVIRHPDLQKFIEQTLAQQGRMEAEIVVYGNEDRFLQLHGAVLTDATGANIGALVVLNDITRLKRLETMRRDFVANLSHELKTPVTALKGCAETLADDSAVTAAERKNFVNMMTRQVTRLEALVNDLLSLSKIEFDAERGKVQLEVYPLADVLRRAANNFSQQAEQKKITVTIDCPAKLTAPLNGVLLEQAVGNLIDNAIKYSPAGTAVRVNATLIGNAVAISVADQGPGIEKKHLPRLFERFYRVDQARSRTMGGTGLGLAIVKHIALSHRGTVNVESVVDQGSVFTIRIPLS